MKLIKCLSLCVSHSNLHTHTNTLSFRHLCVEMNVILIKHIKPPHVLGDLTSVFLWRRATLKPTNLAANHFSFSFALCTLCVFIVVTFLNTGLYVPVTAICKPPLLSFSPALGDSRFSALLTLNTTLFFVFSPLSPGLLSSEQWSPELITQRKKQAGGQLDTITSVQENK